METINLLIRVRSVCCLGTATMLFLLAVSKPSPGQGPGAAADFSLPDVNPNSASAGTSISPRDYLQQVSGWYFGHAT